MSGDRAKWACFKALKGPLLVEDTKKKNRCIYSSELIIAAETFRGAK